MKGFDPDAIPPIKVESPGSRRAQEMAEMRQARRRLARRAEAQAAADKERLPDSFDQRLAAARAAVAPSEPIAYRFVAREGGFQIIAITQEDLAPKV